MAGATRGRAARWASTAVRLPWPRSSPAPRFTCAMWGLAAAVSVAWAVYTAVTIPDSQSDLFEVRSWLSSWITTGASPYLAASLHVDYPPFAFVVLRWLAFGSDQQAQLFYPLVNAAISIGACWLLIRWFSELAEVPLSGRDTTALTAMLLASRAMRIAIQWGQTAPFALLLFVLSLLFARRKPWLAGACFALACYKVNLAAGFGLAFLLLGYVWPLAIAGTAVVLMTLLFAASIHQSVGQVLTDYLATFSAMYAGPNVLPNVAMMEGVDRHARDVTGVRSVLAAVVPDHAVLQVVYPLVVSVMLVALLVLARRARHDAHTRAVIVVACLLWSLASLTHERYNAVLVFPALWMLQWPEYGLIRHRWLRWSVSTAALVFLVSSVPFRVEVWIAGVVSTWPPDLVARLAAWSDAIWLHGTRLIVLATFWLTLRKLARAAEPVPLPARV